MKDISVIVARWLIRWRATDFLHQLRANQIPSDNSRLAQCLAYGVALIVMPSAGKREKLGFQVWELAYAFWQPRGDWKGLLRRAIHVVIF